MISTEVIKDYGKDYENLWKKQYEFMEINLTGQVVVFIYNNLIVYYL